MGFTIDPGHEATLARSAEMVGEDLQHDNRARYPLGMLWLRGQLADPGISHKEAQEQAKARHDAGLSYAADYWIVWGGAGPASAKSHLASIVEGIRGRMTEEDSELLLAIAEKLGRKIAAVRNLPPPHNPFPYHVLHKVAFDQGMPESEAEVAALLRALDELTPYRPSKLRPTSAPALDEAAEPQQRVRGLPVEFHHDPNNPDPLRPHQEAIEASIAKMRASLKARAEG